jgi:hypothetical protein
VDATAANASVGNVRVAARISSWMSMSDRKTGRNVFVTTVLLAPNSIGLSACYHWLLKGDLTICRFLFHADRLGEVAIPPSATLGRKTKEAGAYLAKITPALRKCSVAVVGFGMSVAIAEDEPANRIESSGFDPRKPPVHPFGKNGKRNRWSDSQRNLCPSWKTTKSHAKVDSPSRIVKATPSEGFPTADRR